MNGSHKGEHIGESVVNGAGTISQSRPSTNNLNYTNFQGSPYQKALELGEWSAPQNNGLTAIPLKFCSSSHRGR